MLQCEFDKRKQTWIKSLSRPVMPTEDVERLGDDMVFDYVRDEERWLCRRRCTCTPSLQLQGFVLAEPFFQGLPRHRPPNQNGISRAYVARTPRFRHQDADFVHVNGKRDGSSSTWGQILANVGTHGKVELRLATRPAQFCECRFSQDRMRANDVWLVATSVTFFLARRCSWRPSTP